MTINAAAAADTRLVIRYDFQPCGRCGGGGHYSYNQITGTRCFGCGGSGEKLTRAAGKAHAAIEAMRVEAYGKPASEVRVGDRAKLPGRGMGAPACWQTVTAIETHRFEIGGVAHEQLAITGTKGGWGGIGPTATIQVWTPAGAEAVLAFAATQKGARVEPKNTPAPVAPAPAPVAPVVEPAPAAPVVANVYVPGTAPRVLSPNPEAGARSLAALLLGTGVDSIVTRDGDTWLVEIAPSTPALAAIEARERTVRYVPLTPATCTRCGGTRPADQSCGCFDNASE